jgi:hypothetical protein
MGASHTKQAIKATSKEVIPTPLTVIHLILQKIAFLETIIKHKLKLKNTEHVRALNSLKEGDKLHAIHYLQREKRLEETIITLFKHQTLLETQLSAIENLITQGEIVNVMVNVKNVMSNNRISTSVVEDIIGSIRDNIEQTKDITNIMSIDIVEDIDVSNELECMMGEMNQELPKLSIKIPTPKEEFHEEEVEEEEYVLA